MNITCLYCLYLVSALAPLVFLVFNNDIAKEIKFHCYLIPDAANQVNDPGEIVVPMDPYAVSPQPSGWGMSLNIVNGNHLSTQGKRTIKHLRRSPARNLRGERREGAGDNHPRSLRSVNPGCIICSQSKPDIASIPTNSPVQRCQISADPLQGISLSPSGTCSAILESRFDWVQANPRKGSNGAPQG